MTDVMLDLETWGTRPGCAIRSIGACVFDRKDAPPRRGAMATFYANVTDESCAKLGLIVEPSTKQWWDSPSNRAASAHLLKDQISLEAAVFSFYEWFVKQGGKYVWCHGATFDVPIIEAASMTLGLPPPWRFQNVRDTRTVYDVFGPVSFPKREGTHHNALDDAIHQARCVQVALNKGRLV